MANVKIVEAGGLRFGEGLPKVCVPLTGPTPRQLWDEAAQAAALPADLYEWRLDAYGGDPLPALPRLGESLRKPLLCTLRTAGEGGAARVSAGEYEERLAALLKAGGFALVDIELRWGRETVSRLVSLARERGVGVVISQHDFEKTPPAREIAAALKEMKALGADLPKVAVMPQSPGDVLALLSATWRAWEEIGPVITMSMGELGKLTRACGGVFGSCLTFGAGQNASAPGQLEARCLRAIVEELVPAGGKERAQ